MTIAPEHKEPTAGDKLMSAMVNAQQKQLTEKADRIKDLEAGMKNLALKCIYECGLQQAMAKVIEKDIRIKELEKALSVYADPEHEYHIESTRVVGGGKVHIMKSIIKKAELAKNALKQ